MMRMLKIRAGFILSLFVGGLLLVGCSGEKDGSNNGKKGETTKEKAPADGQQKPPSFGNNQQSDTVTDEQLKQFQGAMDSNRSIQQDMMPAMQNAIKDAGLSMKEYREINRKKQGAGRGMQGKQQSTDISEEQLKKFNKAKQNLKPVQQEMRKKMKAAIQEQGLSMEEYRRILRKIRQDRSLQKRMQQMGQDNTRQQPGKPAR